MPPPARAESLAALRDGTFDLLVIGGGITGCGIARAAALRGLTVALVEKNDFGSGTSSRSSRLVHGGVRYLEHGHIHLVFESSAERRRLLRMAPHLVRPLAFTWPVYEHARIPRWKLTAGLVLYDALALFRNVGRHRRLDRHGVLEREPMLRHDGLRGGAVYYDAATDDARLTLANAIGAAEAGAIVVNHAHAGKLCVEGSRVAGATISDTLSGDIFDVDARVVVNATGPWSDDVRRLDEQTGATVRGSKGAHIALPRELIGNRGALTLLAPQDGRVFFILPSGSQTIIGTTEGYTTSPPDQVRASRDDVEYLLEAANAFFPNARLTVDQVTSAWAGIRPLLPASNANPGSVTREHAITMSRHGLVSITGGKLTTYRIMARDVLRAVAKLSRNPATRFPRRDPAGSMSLPGGDFDSLEQLITEATARTGDAAFARHLVHSYGSRWVDVLHECNAADGMTAVAEGAPYRLGELRYSVRREMARTLADLLLRRTHLGYELRDHGASAAARVADAVGPLLGWDDSDRRRAVSDYEAEAAGMFTIEPGGTDQQTL
jgi:glycerol-3-phosphate dehydrogenase